MTGFTRMTQLALTTGVELPLRIMEMPLLMSAAAIDRLLSTDRERHSSTHKASANHSTTHHNRKTTTAHRASRRNGHAHAHVHARAA